MARTVITRPLSNNGGREGDLIMRTAIVFALAAALAATPAAAQNDTANSTVDANATTMAMPADNGTMAANDMNALPPEPDVTETTAPAPAPAPARAPRGFPWGVVGLVGLVGLLGRKRRD
jgi:hypothetical protein